MKKIISLTTLVLLALGITATAVSAQDGGLCHEVQGVAMCS